MSLIGRCNPLLGKRILLLEDSFLISMEMKLVLGRMGLEVVGPYASTNDVVLGEAPPLDLGLLDVNVRDGSSIALAEELESKGVGCVISTGYSSIEALPAALSQVPILMKPISHEELRAALVQRLEAE